MPSGSLLNCIQEIESSVPSEAKPACRKLAICLLDLESRLEVMEAETKEERPSHDFIKSAQAQVKLLYILIPLFLLLSGWIWKETVQEIDVLRAEWRAMSDVDDEQTRLIAILNTRVDNLHNRFDTWR